MRVRVSSILAVATECISLSAQRVLPLFIIIPLYPFISSYTLLPLPFL